MAAFLSSAFLGDSLRSPGSVQSNRVVAMSAEAKPSPKLTLYGTPVSNYTARVRYLIYRKNLSNDHIDIQSPGALGGLKTEEYTALNPLGKMPLALIHADDNRKQQPLYESSIICEYIADSFHTVNPTFVPSTPEKRAQARLICNLLDLYVGPHHPYMYKKGYENRDKGVSGMNAGLDAIEKAMDENGPYAVGDALSIADCCLWGNWPFYQFMLPTFFGWNVTDGRPKLAAWSKHMFSESDAARKVFAEVFEGLHGWWDNGRWENLSMQALTSRPTLPF